MEKAVAASRRNSPPPIIPRSVGLLDILDLFVG